MVRFSSLASLAAPIVLLAPFLFAQNAPSPSQPASETATRNLEQTETVFSSDEKLQYFVLEHRAPEQIEAADAALLQRRRHDVLGEAEFYGYDTSAAGWSYEQSVCTLIPD